MANDEQHRSQRGEVVRPPVAEAKRVIIKVGTSVLTHSDGRLALVRLFGVVELAGDLRRGGREVLIVSSGAIGAGRDALRWDETPVDVVKRQACAAIGQSRLMGLYQQGFAPLNHLTAQILLTEMDFSDRERYLNLRATLSQLLNDGVIPIINENDVVSTSELALTKEGSRRVFGDNDRLSALVASELDADLLVLLTDVDGLYNRDPNLHKDATIISSVEDSESMVAEVTGSTSGVGRGGMRSKIEAANIASRSGCHVVIASGLVSGVPSRVCRGEDVGTWFPASSSMSAHRRWIAFATKVSGILNLDAGAAEALKTRGASLLPAGVTKIEGDFRAKDVVELRSPEGELVGRGIVQVDSETSRAWVEGKQQGGGRALVRRERMALERTVYTEPEKS